MRQQAPPDCISGAFTRRWLAPVLGARVRSIFVVIGVLLLLMTAHVGVGSAAKPTRIITLGESLSQAERDQLLVYFKAAPNEKPIYISTDETIKAMQGIYSASLISSAYSSSALTCRDLGDGLEVTTHNISVVNPGLYAMALVTAGIGDADLVVAAPDDVSNVQGMTALAGVFKAWQQAPCASGHTSEARQRLALEELTLTVQIGQALGTATGAQQATAIVLETQKTIVTKRLKDSKAISDAIAAQERAVGVTIPADLRAKLVDFMTRLANQNIDWSTFSEGWQITWDTADSRISMTGEGIAIRNARATATAQAGAAMTATARAQWEMTATAAAAMTATANAQQTATAAAQMTATAAANAALTATARAQPTATPVPTATPIPTATPVPTATPTPAPANVSGTVADVGGGTISIEPTGGKGAPAAYPVAADVKVELSGQPSTMSAIRKGDRVALTILEPSHQVIAMSVEPAPHSNTLPQNWWLALIGLMGLLLVKRRRTGEPFIIRRK